MVDAARTGPRIAALVLAAAAAAAGGIAIVTSAGAAAGCRASYTLVNQWPGGFTANVAFTNLGDPLTSWRLSWSFPNGQTVTQLWNGGFTQSGANVTVSNAAHNGAVGTNGTASFGFIGTWQTSNSQPWGFALNGVACTDPSLPPTAGSTATARPPTTPPPTSQPPSNPPTSSPPPRPTTYPNPGVVTGDTGAHDPSVVKAPNGTYLLVHTGNNLAIKTSTNRTAWRNAGTVWPNGASWTTAYTGGSANLWAPDISYHNGQYYLYYSASTFGSQRSAIFLATSPTGAAGTWTHRGLVIESSSAVNYNAIDPNLVVDASGQWWLSFGSFWSGIKLIRLDPATGLRSTSDTAVRALASRPSNVSGAVEAPTIIRRGGYYYLFASFDFCCRGADSTYRVTVGRSASITGPYVDRNGTALTAGGGTEVLAGHGSIHGPGHQAVLADADADVLFYHYYTDSGAARLGINLLAWDAAAWPYVY